ADLGLDPSRWSRVEPLMRALCGEHAAAVCVGRGAVGLVPVATGRVAPDGPDAGPETRFAVASLTKPVVATLTLQAVERGELALGNPVSQHLPDFTGGRKRRVRLRHLLTHTSGLPDLLPDDRELRLAEAPLEEFIQRTIATPLLFDPGRNCRYSSLGFALLWAVLDGAAADGATGLLKRRLFEPLGMTSSSLGAGGQLSEETGLIAQIGAPATDGSHLEDRVPIWNGDYWRRLGAPWGGMIATAADLGRFCAMWASGGAGLLSPATVRVATNNALESMRQVPEELRRCRPWGLGWRLIWPARGAYFGDLLPPRTYGHWGATGTVMWIEPQTGLWAVVVTARPQEPNGAICARLSNAIVASLRDESPLAVWRSGE
ncbi:MAG: serine hydrolase domain-containing protein, partial [Planctomycetota bacterium]